MSSINSVCVQEKVNCKENTIGLFLEKHSTLRKIVAYGPTIALVASSAIERISGYNLTPSFTAPNVAAIGILCAISGMVAGYDQTLKNKKIERINS